MNAACKIVKSGARVQTISCDRSV